MDVNCGDKIITRHHQGIVAKKPYMSQKSKNEVVGVIITFANDTYDGRLYRVGEYQEILTSSILEVIPEYVKFK